MCIILFKIVHTILLLYEWIMSYFYLQMHCAIHTWLQLNKIPTQIVCGKIDFIEISIKFTYLPINQWISRHLAYHASSGLYSRGN